MSQESQGDVSSVHYFASVEMTGLSQFRALSRNVIAVYFEDCSFALQVRRLVPGRNFLLLARQKRKVIVRPQNGCEIFATFSLCDAQMHHERNIAAGVAN